MFKMFTKGQNTCIQTIIRKSATSHSVYAAAQLFALEWSSVLS